MFKKVIILLILLSLSMCCMNKNYVYYNPKIQKCKIQSKCDSCININDIP